MEKLTIIVTVPLVLDTWLKGQAKYLSQYYDVEIITAFSPEVERIQAFEQVPIHLLDFTRKINFFKDIKVLLHLIKHLKRRKPKLVYTLTPKAGLLGMIAAKLAGISFRLHNVVGLPHLDAQGKRRVILSFTERVTYCFASHIYCNSLNLKKEIQHKLTKKPVYVIGNGSVNGVDTELFRDSLNIERKNDIKQNLGIAEGDFVMSFVGRIVKDKGIDELVRAFCGLGYEKVKLLLIGGFENDLNPVSEDVQRLITDTPSIISIPFQQDIRHFLAVTDLFVLPSYREGLPNVLLEAGSYGIPLLASNINGCDEVIIPEETGLLIPSKDEEALSMAMKRFINDKAFYTKIKSNVRSSIKSRYEQKAYLTHLNKVLLEVVE